MRRLPPARVLAIAAVLSAAGVDVARLRADPDAAAVLFTMQAASANKLVGLRDLRDETRSLRRALEAAAGVAGR